MSKIAAVVPAYNEEKTIGEVVSVLRASNSFSELIVVSDGSTDQTAALARQFGATVYERSSNQGKSAAMRYGVEQTTAPLIFFCDADLVGLKPDHIRSLIDPVVAGQAEMCVGLRDRGLMGTWLMRYLPLIGGERVLRRALFEKIPSESFHGYQVELMMNAWCRRSGGRIVRVQLGGLHIRGKMQKVGFWKGLFGSKGYLMMGLELLQAWLRIHRLLARQKTHA